MTIVAANENVAWSSLQLSLGSDQTADKMFVIISTIIVFTIYLMLPTVEVYVIRALEKNMEEMAYQMEENSNVSPYLSNIIGNIFVSMHLNFS